MGLAMQWIIDLVRDTIGPVDHYVDRGDFSGADFTIADFTRDGNWHDLDLSHIVPENTVLVSLRVTLKGTVQDKNFVLRENGNVNAGNVFIMTLQTSNAFFPEMGWVVPDANRVIEYKIDDLSINQVYMAVNGWWVRS